MNFWLVTEVRRNSVLIYARRPRRKCTRNNSSVPPNYSFVAWTNELFTIHYSLLPWTLRKNVILLWDFVY